MRWRFLAGTLAVVLVSAVVFSLVDPLPATVERSGPDAVPPPESAAGGAAPSRAAPASTAAAASAPSIARGPPPSTGPQPSPASPASPTPGPAPPAPRPDSAASAPSRQTASVAPSDAGIPFRVDKAGIMAAVAEKIPELRACYDAWLEANPTLAGKIRVSFTIAKNPDTGLGDIIAIGVLDGGLDHVAIQGCVMNVFKDLHFEAPVDGPVKVNYPISFANTADAGG